ncbi:hypothetical protein FISHEDRAFT_48891 [Fistulina hepatica ATCC 64428]|uniref:Cwf19-like C-terminal domain-containing protein n=1 Tax=Fistulina hepatica ATCC 64428 TaxID=1128425 RepID=A0A0D7A5I1_9AGAR|nr:hypothetical protein FISHEDRAFT_48891 [Fistulina hepatica ATCC 64428]
MPHDEVKSNLKRRHHDKEDPEKRSNKKHKREKYHSKPHRDRAEHSEVHIQDDDDDDGVWVEKNIDMDGQRRLATDIPTAESLKITSQAGPSLRRDDWMMPPEERAEVSISSTNKPSSIVAEGQSLTEGYGEPSDNHRTLGGGVDFFSSLGTEIKKKPKPQQPDPDKPVISSKELNQELRDETNATEAAPPTPKTITPGGPGSQWRMMRLRRVYETAEEENLAIEQVAIERFGSLEAFEEAKEERRILDEREGRRSDRSRTHTGADGERGFIFNDASSSSSLSRSASFRRPGASLHASGPVTPSPPTGPMLTHKRIGALRLPSQANTPLSQTHTPIPSVMTPPPNARRALSPSSLNRLQAKVLRAKLTDAPDAAELEREYERESKRANGETYSSGVRTKVEVLPTLDGRGRLYDVGLGHDDGPVQPGNRRRKSPKVETRDPRTGDIVRYNADDDTTTLGEMLRQEKFGAGMQDQKDFDAQFARAIMGDGKFENDLEYIDDNAERLGRQKMRSDAMKRQFAINDYRKTQKVLASCPFCFSEDDALPHAPIVAMGTRAYLSCTTHEELVKGHCLIVPIQHHLTMLEADDDVWDEVRNFMKCVMRMFSEEDKGVVFYETVISLKWQAHTVIECVPLPWEVFDIIPGYFKESILTAEAEWSTHKKLIDFSARPGGFRRAMVPNLPYFMVQFDYKGEKGYGHVIEGSSEALDEQEGAVDEGAKGGGDFPKYFAGEIIGNVLELEPRKWRRPKRIDFHNNKRRVAEFKAKYDKFDWTGMIGKT